MRTLFATFQKQEGFTLVELLVSLSIFTIVVVAAVGSLYTVNQASVKVNAMRTVLDNLNFATESMSRTIRTSEHIDCGGPGAHIGGPNCLFSNSNGSSEIAFDSTLGTPTLLDYQLVNGQIIRCNVSSSDGYATTAGASIIGSTCVAITAPQLNVQSLVFFVNGADPADGLQPSVMIRMQGLANAGAGNIAPFSVQTYVSQRTAE